MVLESNTLDVLFVKDGQQGEDGKVLYTWIKYAKDANGTGMTDDPNGAIYIGISYNNESSIESNDPTQYAWTKIQGAEGKKGEDAYTIFLENENISFATDENRDPLSEQAYTSGITIMKGAKPVTDFTIGDIAKTQGIAVAKTDTAIAISVINGNPLPSDNGEIVIPITVGGTVFKKILSWTCSKKGDKGIQGIQGPQGVQGEKGKDGTSVTISNKSITYQLSASGTVVPTGTWQTSPQTIPEGQYQWTKTSVTYSDGNKTESYSISYRGKNGSDGTSVKTTSTSVKYQVGDSGITKPTGTWQNSVPTVAQGKYLWTQTIVNYSDGNSTESYSVSYRGIDGSNGVNGMNAATIYLYQRATSTPSKPSNTLTYTFSTTKITGTLNNGWSTAIPTGTDAVYVTVASVSSKNDTATIATSAWSAPVVLAQNGKTGSDGKAGLNVATIYLYQRNTSKPSKPSASVAYTFSTGVASGLNNGWSQKIPDGTNPLYVTLATASSNTATDTILSSEWSDVVVMAQNGEDGISPKVSLSKTGGTTTISIVDATGTHTQSVKDGTNGTPGTDGKDGKTSYFHVKYSNDGGKTFTGNSGEDTGIYMGSYTDYTEADSTDVKKYNWVKVKGDKGDTGQKGQDGTSVKITSKSVTYQTSTSGTTAPTGTWVTTVPTVNNGQYLWTKTTVQYSDGNKTEAYSVSYKGTNGTNGTSVTVSKTEVTYQVSTSGTTAPTGTWSTTMPSCDQGQYLWTKTYVKYSDGKETTSYSVSYKGVDGEKFAFNMLRETNQGSKHWEQHSSGGKYSVEDFITEDNINAVKLICTEAISTSNWSYVSFKDIKMLKQLKPSTKYTLSYDIKANRSGTISHSICNGDASNFCTNTVVVNNIIGNETWQHISVVLTTNDLKTTPTNEILYLGRNALSKVGYSIIKNLKLTEGIVDTPWAPHPEDLEGRGVSQTVQYYLATSQAFGVTSSTSGWSTDITTQKLTADKKYLWNCYQTKYSDGTSEPISTPKVIGVYGDKGDNAKNLSITPSSQYFKSTDGGKTFTPDTITIKPTIQGEINFGKWQYSIDGGVSFADVMSGQKGLMISNNVLTVSKDSSLYSDAVTMVTFRAVASDSSFYDTCSIAKIYDVSDIGDGRNLLWNSNFAKTDETINTSTYTTWGLILRGSTYTATIDTSVKHNNFNTLKVIGTKAGENGGQDLIYRIKGLNLDEVKFTEIDVKYTLSFYAKASIACNFSARYSYDSYAKDTNVALSTDWKRYEIQMHPTTASYQTSLIFKMDAASTVWFSEFKLEKGSSATGYSTAPEDVQMEILSTKSEISDVSLKVDNNRQAIEQRVEKTTYEQDLNLVKGDISKANEGLNKWRYEIYPKSLFTSEYQGKSTMDVFAKNTNLTPSQSVLINDTDLSIAWNYAENYIGYALTFTKFSAAKSVVITFAHDDGAHIYLNGKLIGGSDAYSQTGESLTLGFVKGWNCIEVVVNEGANTEGFKLGTTISAISECQLMNCYYGTPVARQSHITNQLVQNTTDINGISGSVQQVMSAVGGSGNVDEFVNNYSTWKNKVDNIETRVGKTYTTKDDFNGLEIGGRNLARDTSNEYSTPYTNFNGSTNTCFYDKRVYLNGLKAGDTITVHMYVKYDDVVPTSGQTARMWIQGSGNVTVWNSGTFPGSSRQSLSGSSVCEILYSATVYKDSEKNQYWDCCIRTDYIQSGSVQVKSFKVEKGNKATDWTPAPEDNEVNGQNLASNLPSSWEQGTVTEGSATGTTYTKTKSSSAGSIRPKELIPVSGDITISTAYSNQSKKPIRHWIAAYDVNKNYLGRDYVSCAWNSFPRTLNMKDAKYIAIMVGYTDSSAITPSDISQICLKIERGTSATPFTLAPEDINGKIQSVETIATQTADKFSWLVKSGTSSSNFELTDKTATLVASKINQYGLVTFNGLDDTTKDKINTTTGGNLITVTPANPKSDYGGGQTYNVTADDKGGRCVQWNSSCASFLLLNSYTPVNFTSSDQLYYDIRVPNWSSTTFDTKLTIWFYNKNKANITSASKTLTLKSTIWNHFTGYLTLPSSSNWGDLYYYIIGLTNPNKQAIGITNDSYIERVNSYATTYAKNAVDWVGQNGTNTNNMYNMVSKWTDGAVSDTTQINGGWIKTNTITANKIAIGDFTNYADINESNTYWFRAEQTKEGTWFYRDGSELQRDNVISELHTCRGGEKFYVEYDISNTIKEGDEYKYAGLMIFGYDGNGGIVSYARNAGVTATANGEITHITTQLTMPDTTRSFRVYLQIEGHVPFTGTLKIRNISVRKAVTGNLIVDGAITADKIATDAIKSRNYISSGGTQGSFLNLSDGSFKSPNLSWDSNGNLIAKNANLSGEITATNGSIAGWTIISNKMYTTGSGKYTGIGKYGSAYAFWAGATSNDNGNSAVFKVGHTGKLTATDADITGTITATNGKIGRYDITSTYLMTNSGSNASGIGGNQAFWAGAEDSNSAPFRVGYDGVLWAENAAIRGSIETGNLGDEGDTVSIINGHIGIQGTSNNVEIYSTGFKFGIDGDYYLMSVSEGVKCYRNLYATDFVADGWLYCSEVHSSGAVVIGADSESFYWAHGYQIARGTSWGGVCVGDDSQQLRLYGSSIWASHSISTSDENLKENFTTLDQYENFYMNLNPIGFNYIGDYDGKKTHFGFGAHKTEYVLESEGYDADKFAVVTHRPLVQEDIEKRFGKDVEVDIETEYGVSYTEFIALNTHMIQKTRRELTKVKQEKADLEVRLQAIEAKLGL